MSYSFRVCGPKTITVTFSVIFDLEFSANLHGKFGENQSGKPGDNEVESVAIRIACFIKTI